MSWSCLLLLIGILLFLLSFSFRDIHRFTFGTCITRILLWMTTATMNKKSIQRLCLGRHSTDKRRRTREEQKQSLSSSLFSLTDTSASWWKGLAFCCPSLLFLRWRRSVCRSSIDFLSLRFSSADDKEGCNIRRVEPSCSFFTDFLKQSSDSTANTSFFCHCRTYPVSVDTTRSEGKSREVLPLQIP